ncbi:peptidoglycan endopeptidase [Geobacter pelophilus]|uniref:Peptidoglycan endopeptidase n=1 Tax=Geoanaerobacter pelophilus TaxID=60036 RepID=A0AAW4L3B5_9BACT|nr:peptidoglycan endopeptidase [Geoanaerobacter pelophilus]
MLLPLTLQAQETTQRFAIAESPTPVLNTPGFNDIFANAQGNNPKTDNCGQVRELEFIALPGTVFAIQQEINTGTTVIYRVTTGDYPHAPANGLFIDSRFVSTTIAPPSPRRAALSPKKEIIQRLRNSAGVEYVWGGNVKQGIPKLADLYSTGNRSLSLKSGKKVSFAGLDCSGLLYEASNGWTPRNTSELVAYGKSVAIEGLDLGTIVRKLRPLDLIVWPGHVLIALDHGEVIESRLYCDGRKSGVVIRPLHKRLSEILRNRKPVNSIEAKGGELKNSFVVRRWIEP